MDSLGILRVGPLIYTQRRTFLPSKPADSTIVDSLNYREVLFPFKYFFEDFRGHLVEPPFTFIKILTLFKSWLHH